jgi:hypothetical protein
VASLLNKLNLGFLGSMGQKDGFVAIDIGSSSVEMVEAVPENGWLAQGRKRRASCRRRAE